MLLRYKKADGTQSEFELSERPITIGRSPDADVVVLDERASRLHCGIRSWDGEFYVKDLKSKNGTFLNEEPVEMAKLTPGDSIRVGGTVFQFEQEAAKGSSTVLHEMEQEMATGKGYSTILREIVHTAGDEGHGVEQPAASAPRETPPIRIKTRPPSDG